MLVSVVKFDISKCPWNKPRAGNNNNKNIDSQCKKDQFLMGIE